MENYNYFLNIVARMANTYNQKDVEQIITPELKNIIESKYAEEYMPDWIEGHRRAIKQLINDIKNTKVFRVDEQISSVFMNTKNKDYTREVPYDNFFIDCEITIEEGIAIKGLLLLKDKTGIIVKGFWNTLKNSSNPILRGFSEEQPFILDLFTYDETTNKECRIRLLKENPFQGLIKQPIHQEIIRNYVCNFLDFLNHPDVETRIIKWGTNESRIKRGKFPIPDQIMIKLGGKLHRYIYEELPKMKKECCEYAFWVRGHYIHFWNKEIYRRLYSLSIEELNKERYYLDKKGIVCRWILPYIKNKEMGEIKKRIYHIIKT